MECRVVSVSGPDGVQMREIAQGMAETLGFALVDEAIIVSAAAGAGLEPEVMADVERPRSSMERTIKGFASGVDASPFAYAGVGGLRRGGLNRGVALAEPAGEKLRDLIRSAIEEFAGQGSMVIVAHAASHALASRSDVLRVLVTASQTTRRGRVGSQRELSENDAARAIDQSEGAEATT
jgi:hypothetical protein